jgi:hypothetical protein
MEASHGAGLCAQGGLVEAAPLLPKDDGAEISSLEGSELMAVFRAMEDTTQRRTLTAQVYALKVASWKQHPSFRRTMAHHLVVDVHPMFRDAFAEILQESEAAGEVDRVSFSQWNANLHGHHSIEDRSIFPRMRRQHPEMVGEMDILEEDHKSLRALEGRIEAGELSALREFVAALGDHLNREEMICVQYLLSGTNAFG